MQHYQFHIGDYAQTTAHLSPMEDLAYRRLLDLYYATEAPIPNDLKTVSRKIRLDPTSVEQVLNEFFILTPEGFTHHRCDKELESIYSKSDAARKSAEVRWERQRNANAMRTHTEGNAVGMLPITHYPLPVNPEPVTQDPRPRSQKPEANQTESKPLQPAAPAAPKKPALTADETALQAVCRETWSRYSEAYSLRYGTAPVRNTKVNGQVKQFCQRVPGSEAPAIAAFFVRHNAAFYVGKGHAIGQLLADAEKIRTEWATNQTITATQAQQADKTQANGNVWGKVIADIEERNRNAAIN